MHEGPVWLPVSRSLGRLPRVSNWIRCLRTTPGPEPHPLATAPVEVTIRGQHARAAGRGKAPGLDRPMRWLIMMRLLDKILGIHICS